MTAGDGRAALVTLRRLQRRAWRRHAFATLKRPRNVALLLFGAALVALMIVPQFLYDAGHSAFSGRAGALYVGAGLVALTVLTIVSGLRNGAIYFKPPEIQFLLPGPLTSRDLVRHHLVANSVRSAFSVVIFALFVRPRDASSLRVVLAYALAFVAMTVVQTRVDLAHAHLMPTERRARGRAWAIGITLAAAAAAGAAWLADGREMSPDVLRWVALPAWPATAVMTGTALEGLVGAALLVAVTAWLWRGALRDPPDVREGALRMSEHLANVIDNARRGRMAFDGKRERARSMSLAWVPRLRGAGLIAWRQLVTLRRSRGAFGMLLYIVVVSAVVSGFVVDEADQRPFAIAAAVLSVLAFTGPMYVRCDFRGDDELFPYLRSLPISPTALAWGQLLPTALVLALLQWALAGWGLFLAPRPYWVAGALALALLPLVNVWQLAIWNGAHLLAPSKVIDEQGQPSATQLARSALVMVVLMLALMATSVPVVAAATLTGYAAHEWLGASQGIAAIPAVVAGGAVLAVEVAVLVMIVGRIFTRARV